MRLGRLGAAWAVVGLLVAPSAVEAATLAGRLVNKTAGGQGVGAIEVTLTTYREGKESGKRTARTDGQGRFRFSDLQAGAGWSHAVSVNYQGGEYLADPVTFEGTTAERAVEVPVFDATRDPRALSVKLHHVIFDEAANGVRVTEVLVVRNPGDKTYVGDRELADGRRATLRFTLPAGAADIRYGDGLMACCAVPADGGFADTMDVKPGVRQVAFSYTFSGRGGGVQFTRPLDYPTDAVDLFVPEGTRIAASSGLQAAGVVSGENAKRYTRLTGGSQTPPARLTLAVEGVPGAGRRWWLSAGALLAALAAAAGVYPLVRWGRRRGLWRPAGAAPLSDLDRAVRRAELRAALAALEEARAAGGVPEEDYRRLAAGKREELEGLGASAAAVERPGAGRGPRRLWWAGAALVMLGVVGGFLLVGGARGLLGAGGAPRLAVTPDIKDFGEVRRDAGKLEAVFALRNEGRAPLRILRIVPT